MRHITERDRPVGMAYDITSIDQLIDVLGGPSAIGEWLGITQEAVSNWKARRSIPPGWHFKLAKAARARGCSIDPQVFGLEPDDAPFLNWAVA